MKVLIGVGLKEKAAFPCKGKAGRAPRSGGRVTVLLNSEQQKMEVASAIY
jgi:hypothetical protein